jgi:hypothetical protein
LFNVILFASARFVLNLDLPAMRSPAAKSCAIARPFDLFKTAYYQIAYSLGAVLTSFI